MKNCFLCDRTDCPNQGIDGCWGDEWCEYNGITSSPFDDEEEESEDEEEESEVVA